MLRHGASFQDAVVRVVAQAGHKEYPAIGEPLIPLIVHIPAVKHQDRAGRKLPLPRDFTSEALPSVITA